MVLANIPKKMPLIVIQNDVLLPGSTMQLPISGLHGKNMVQSRLLSNSTAANSIIGVITVEDAAKCIKYNKNSDGITIGTAAFVMQVVGSAKMYTLYVCGLCRFSLEKMIMVQPYSMGVVTQLDYYSTDDTGCESCPHVEGIIQTVRDLATIVVTKLYSQGQSSAATDLEKTIANAGKESLPDVVMSFLKASYEDKKDVLYTLDVNERMKIVLSVLQKQISDMNNTRTRNEAPKPGIIILRIPRDQKSLIGHRKTLDGDIDNSDNVSELEELQDKIGKANLPANVNKIIMRDFHRLKRMGPFNPEDSVLRSYIEFVSDLPWNIASTETIDIKKAKLDLDREHYGLVKVKKRVLEYLAVRQLKPSVRGPILCFVGPPGVGKTSIGRSIAHTLGRQFQRISLGGVNNQADIRGHRRTYIGAMPGRIIQAIKNAGVNNPVILLDELDKMSKGFHGDPAAALLEVLDPLQNHQFLDHYLNVPFDLSRVTFIATANHVVSIPPPLLDRTEIIQVSGYTLDEKVHIAQKHLLPKQLRENGIDENMITVVNKSLEKLISFYTREAGVRSLERKLGALCRSVALKVAENDATIPTEINVDALENILGPPLYSDVQLSSRVGTPGVAVGLAWTEQGGSLLVVEASKVPGGEGKLCLTGRLGKVMKESAHLALNWLRAVAHQYGLVQEGEDLMSDINVHIHFPEGAVSKEGPSAGITVATALVSLFADVPLIPDLALTGELTLRGIVLPVGGVKEKLLAAHRAGLKKVILPKLSMKDLFHVPNKVKEDIQVLFVESMNDVIEAAFDGLVPSLSASHSSLQSRL